VATSGPPWRRPTTALVGSVVLTVVVTACTGPDGAGTGDAFDPSRAAPIGSATTAAGAVQAPPEAADPTRAVSCDVHTCTVTLRTTDPSEVEAFGAPLSLDRVADGVAGLTVGDASVECRADESVQVGAVTLYCDAVTPTSVTLTTEVG